MGKVHTSPGSNADLDVITAGAGDIRKNKVIVDRDGNPLTGTMPELGARTITPGASAQTIGAGSYLTGAQTIPGFALPAANTIKKGTKITIYGRSVTGTWEGYVASVYDIYNRGVWGSGYSAGNVSYCLTAYHNNVPAFTYEATAIKGMPNSSGTGGFKLTKLINLTPYKTINMIASTGMSNASIGIYVKDKNGDYNVANNNTAVTLASVLKNVTAANKEEQVSLDISGINVNAVLAFIFFAGGSSPGYLHKIWFT